MKEHMGEDYCADDLSASRLLDRLRICATRIDTYYCAAGDEETAGCNYVGTQSSCRQSRNPLNLNKAVEVEEKNEQPEIRRAVKQWMKNESIAGSGK